MNPDDMTREELLARLAEAEETIEAIRRGEVDAVVGIDPRNGRERVFTLKGADHPYRIMVEQMSEAAATLSAEGLVLYANPRLPELLGLPAAAVLGASFKDFVSSDLRTAFEAILAKGIRGGARGEACLTAADGTRLCRSTSRSAPCGSRASRSSRCSSRTCGGRRRPRSFWPRSRSGGGSRPSCLRARICSCWPRRRPSGPTGPRASSWPT